MASLRRLWTRIQRGLSLRWRDEQDLDEEIRFHLAQEQQLAMDRGESPEQARFSAQRAFGSTAHVKEATRAVWVWTVVEQTVQDLRIGLRMLRRSPAFTTAAVATLALGIGANTAIFTLFDALVLQRLPVTDPARLVLFSDITGEGTSRSSLPPQGRWDLFSTDAYNFLRQQPLGFEELAAVRSGETEAAMRFPTRDTSGATYRGQAHLVSGNFFAAMDVNAALGRTLSAVDDRPNAQPSAVISDGFWRQRLNGDVGAVGRTMIVNGTAFTIVGVAPRGFFGERVRRSPDVWVPLTYQPQIEQRPAYSARVYWLTLVGRLAPGRSRDTVTAAANLALQNFVRNQAGTEADADLLTALAKSRIELFDGARGISGLREMYSDPLRILLATVGLVLLLACANIGNLLLSRAAARRSEMSLRMALGAGPLRVVRQMLAESLLLAICGAAAGLVVAHWIVTAALELIVSRTSPVHAAIDVRVLGFTLLVTCAAAIAFGLIPALAGSRVNLMGPLKHGGGPSGMRAALGGTRLLVVVQIAISLVLLIGAALFARSLRYLEHQSLGFDQEHVALDRLDPKLGGYTPGTVPALYREIYDRVRALPGAQAVTLAGYSPFSGNSDSESASVQGYALPAHEHVELEVILVGPSYPEAMGIPLHAGRSIGEQDVAGAPRIAMVNDTFAQHFFPGASAVGHRFGIGGPDAAGDIEIVGVLGDAQFHDDAPTRPMVFLPLAQDATESVLEAEVAVRTTGDPRALTALLRGAITSAIPGLPSNDARLLTEQVSSKFNRQRLASRLVSGFGGLALLLACVGLYGVMAQSVIRRTKEIGVRMALGAGRRDVLWMILKETSALLAIGLGGGLVAAALATRVVASQLYGITPGDPWSFLLALFVLSAVGGVTAFIPANRASRIEPVVALRCD